MNAPPGTTRHPKSTASSNIGPDETDGSERIAKFLARAGVCSRRDAERLIEEKRVRVNGLLLDTPAFKVNPSDKIMVDGKPIAQPEQTRLWRYHKPNGLVTTHRDPQDRPTVFQHLPPNLPRVVSIGRLDLNSEGLLLLTNDGGLARVLELPATGWVRRYRVRAYGRITQEELNSLAKGITVDGITYGPIEVVLEKGERTNSWMMVSLKEGKNREIRRVLEAIGLKVNRLIRVSYGPFQLSKMLPGVVEEVPTKHLRDHLGAIYAPARAPSRRAHSSTKPTKAAT